MPQLHELITVGFCKGYGDGDYRVSMAVRNLSRKEMQELTNTMFWATKTAWDSWLDAQPKEEAATEPNIAFIGE